jgi:hypothetical protein
VERDFSKFGEIIDSNRLVRSAIGAFSPGGEFSIITGVKTDQAIAQN